MLLYWKGILKMKLVADKYKTVVANQVARSTCNKTISRDVAVEGLLSAVLGKTFCFWA